MPRWRAACSRGKGTVSAQRIRSAALPEGTGLVGRAAMAGGACCRASRTWPGIPGHAVHLNALTHELQGQLVETADPIALVGVWGQVEEEG